MEDPTKEPLELGFRQKACLLVKVHEDEKAAKYIEKGVEKLYESFDMFKIISSIRKLEPPKDEEKGDDKHGDKKEEKGEKGEKKDEKGEKKGDDKDKDTSNIF